MTLGELRKEIDNKQVDVLKGQDYAFEIDEESVFENDLEYELLINDIEEYIVSLIIPIRIV